MGEETELLETVRGLLSSQRLAVLSTRSGDQPYSNLICFVASDDLKRLFFATTRSTRKYANLMREERVALLLDDRSDDAGDTFRALAVTVLGVARELKDEIETGEARAAYVARHPHLEEFVSSPSTALLRLDVERYILVRRFQDVSELRVTP
jgi:nitroimidazol reductase NimA-like FMN-containing flavoprotein (pyridoxamine 5'-phosphate oxidase superfamily)